MKPVAVTGADGFIGLHLCALLEQQGVPVVRIVRREAGPGIQRHVESDLGSPRRLEQALKGVDAVVHLAARAHVLAETGGNPEAAFRSANVDATLNLAKAARIAGVRRLVFVSSIGVNGSRTTGTAFTEDQPAAPSEPYAISKWEAERALAKLADRASPEITIVRPTLVYGPEAPGNFARLIKLAQLPFALPLGGINNRRSLISAANLCELLALCIQHPRAAGELFLAAEPGTHSTADIIAAIRSQMNRSGGLLNVPPVWLRAAATLLGKRAVFDKLASSLEVSTDKIRRVLGWHARYDFESQIAAAVSAFRSARAGKPSQEN